MRYYYTINGLRFLMSQYFYIIIIFILFSGCSERKVLIPEKKQSKHSAIKSIKKYPFQADEWTTNENPNSYGSKDAKKGGEISIPISEFPPTYRTIGKDTRLMIISLLEGLCYETLLSFDASTLQYVPSLATHWRISEDKQSYMFRIDKKAKFSDGHPVTAYDVLYTYKLITDKGIQDPALSSFYKDTFFEPEVLDKYTVRVRCKRASWRNFLYFSGLTILPGHHLKKIDGREFLKKYKYYMMPGSGPYKLNLKASIKGRKLILKRRDNYWASNKQVNQGIYNFDKIKFIVVQDDRLKLEKFKKGELDFYIPSRAKWWLEELNENKFEALKRNQVLKKKIFNYKPLGMSGLAFNTLEPPFDDKKVREAFSKLWNVDQLLKQLFYEEYIRTTSYFQGTVYENNDNIRPRYDPQEAIKLLHDAGWTRNSNEQWLTKNSKIFELDLAIDTSLNKVFTPFQQDLRKAGIKLNIINMTSQAIFKNVMKRKFKITYMGWTGSSFPNPESSLHSKYARLEETGNICGISLKEVDDICDTYNSSYKVPYRVSLLQKLDKILTGNYYYALGWVAPYALRASFWNKFSSPKASLSYAGDWRAVLALWWFDKKKNNALQCSFQDKNLKLPDEDIINDYWKKLK